MRKQFVFASVVAVVALLPIIITGEFFLHLLVMTLIFGIFSIGYNAQFGYSGLLNLGHAAFFGLGGYASAITTVNYGLPAWIGLLVGILLALLISLLVGLLSLRMRGAQFAMMTLGLSQLGYLFVINSIDLTRGPLGISGIPSVSVSLGDWSYSFLDARAYAYLALGFVVLVSLALLAILRSRLGSAWQCVRENEALAASLGIDARFARVTAFMFGCVLAAISGSLYAHYIRLVTPELLSLHYTVMALIVVVIGGQGSFLGPLFGSVLFTILPEVLRFTADLRMAVFGVLLLVFITFLPSGLAPYLRRLSKTLTGDELAKGGQS